MGRYSAIVLCLIFLFSCGKDEILFIPDTDTVDGQQQLLSNFTIVPQSSRLLLQENDHTIFEGPNNILIDIPKSSLLTKNGKEVRGEVRVEINEFSGARMDLLYAPSAIFEGRLLDYTRVLYIRFSQNNEELVISNPIIAYFNATENETLEDTYLFSGKKSAEGIYWEKFNGLLNGPEKGEWSISVNETVKQIKGYAITISGSDNWYCLAKKMPGMGEDVFELCATITNELPQEGSLTLFISDQSKSVVRLTSKNQGMSPYCTTLMTKSIPLPGKIIHISDTGNQYYKFGIAYALPGIQQPITIVPKTTTKEEIIKSLREL